MDSHEITNSFLFHFLEKHASSPGIYILQDPFGLFDNFPKRIKDIHVLHLRSQATYYQFIVDALTVVSEYSNCRLIEIVENDKLISHLPVCKPNLRISPSKLLEFKLNNKVSPEIDKHPELVSEIIDEDPKGAYAKKTGIISLIDVIEIFLGIPIMREISDLLRALFYDGIIILLNSPRLRTLSQYYLKQTFVYLFELEIGEYVGSNYEHMINALRKVQIFVFVCNLLNLQKIDEKMMLWNKLMHASSYETGKVLKLMSSKSKILMRVSNFKLDFQKLISDIFSPEDLNEIVRLGIETDNLFLFHPVFVKFIKQHQIDYAPIVAKETLKLALRDRSVENYLQAIVALRILGEEKFQSYINVLIIGLISETSHPLQNPENLSDTRSALEYYMELSKILENLFLRSSEISLADRMLKESMKKIERLRKHLEDQILQAFLFSKDRLRELGLSETKDFLRRAYEMRSHNADTFILIIIDGIRSKDWLIIERSLMKEGYAFTREFGISELPSITSISRFSIISQGDFTYRNEDQFVNHRFPNANYVRNLEIENNRKRFLERIPTQTINIGIFNLVDDVSHKSRDNYSKLISSELIYYIRVILNQASSQKNALVLITSDHGSVYCSNKLEVSKLNALLKRMDLPEIANEREVSPRFARLKSNLPHGSPILKDDFILLNEYVILRGTSTLKAANHYYHGGANLDEIIVPIVNVSLPRRSPRENNKVCYSDQVVAEKSPLHLIKISDHKILEGINCQFCFLVLESNSGSLIGFGIVEKSDLVFCFLQEEPASHIVLKMLDPITNSQIGTLILDNVSVSNDDLILYENEANELMDQLFMNFYTGGNDDE